jgi:hypothetical protein
LRDQRSGHEPAKRRGTPRRALAVLFTATVAAAVATVIALVLVRHGAGASHGLSLLDAARPWLIAGQIAILVLAWHHWPRIVAAFARWRSLSPAQHDALLRGRHRIFVLLSACELLIVLRAFAG